MALSRVVGVLSAAVLAHGAGWTADVGGWYAEQRKAAAAPQQPGCPQQVRLAAAASGTGADAYQAALCYLEADPPDPLAAKAWLARSAQMDFLPAVRLLASLDRAQAAAPGAAPHCHDLGSGRQICHGGAAAAAKTNSTD